MTKINLPIWNGDILEWTDVSSATSYTINLYRNQQFITSIVLETNSLDLSNFLFLGEYQVSVKPELADYDFSDLSTINSKIETLREPYNAQVLNYIFTFDYKDFQLNKDLLNFKNPIRYNVVIYHNNFKILDFDINDLNYDLTEFIVLPGEYKVGVRSTSTQVTRYAPSDFLYTELFYMLTQPSQPIWTDGLAVEWLPVPNLSEYKVIVYCNGEQFDYITTDTSFAIEHTGDINVQLQLLGDNITYYNSLLSDLSELRHKFETPELPTWNGLILSWQRYDHLPKYKVYLYKDDELYQEIESISNHINLDEYFVDQGFYKAKVKVLGDNETYIDSNLSEFSLLVSKLPKPENVRIVGLTGQWDEVDNLQFYDIILYRDDVEVDELQSNIAEIDLSSSFEDLGNYYIKVRLNNNNDDYFLGDLSNASNIIKRLEQLQLPEWDKLQYKKIFWDSVDGLLLYGIVLYKNNELIFSKVVNGTEYVFIDYLSEAGSYYLTIKLLGDGENILSGLTSQHSNILNVNNDLIVSYILSTPETPYWDGETIKWNQVNHLTAYELDIIRNNKRISPQRVVINSRDMTDYLKFILKYRIRVKAIGNSVYEDSLYSQFSEERVDPYIELGYNSIESFVKEDQFTFTSWDNEMTASINSKNEIDIWKNKNWEIIRTLSHGFKKLKLVSWTRDSKYIIIAGESDTHLIELWNKNTWQLLLTLGEGLFDIRNIYTSADGSIISLQSINSIHLFNYSNTENIYSLQENKGISYHFILNINNKTNIYYAYNNSFFKLINTDEETFFENQSKSSDTSLLTVLPNGKYLLAKSEQGTIKIWNIETSELLSVKKTEHFIDKLLWSPDGKFLVLPMNKFLIKIWEEEV